MKPFDAIVMSAGRSTRMKSALPKALHTLAGRPLVSYPVRAALDAGASRVVVVIAPDHDEVAKRLASTFDARVTTTVQRVPRGTGDAARSGAEALPESERFVILNGDAPLLTADAVRALVEGADVAPGPLALLTTTPESPTGYGRILRDAQARIVGVREERDCSAEERAIREANPGMYAVDAEFFRSAIASLGTNNAQGEVYLPDLVAVAARAGGVGDVPWPAEDLAGLNDRLELAQSERMLVRRLVRAHAANGVTFRRPETVHVDADVEIGEDVTIEAQVTLRGRCRIEAGAYVDVGCVLENVVVGAGARVLPYTVGAESEIGPRARIGPFTHLRPGSRLAEDVHLGNFVETKNTRIGKGSKANHLAYLGDGEIGERVNVGAGTIFCNYDGYGKYVTVLEDGVFVGSDSQLVAPVRVGKDGYIATGTTVTLDVPADALAVGRARQENKQGYASRIKASLKARAEKAKKGKP